MFFSTWTTDLHRVKRHAEQADQSLFFFRPHQKDCEKKPLFLFYFLLFCSSRKTIVEFSLSFKYLLLIFYSCVVNSFSFHVQTRKDILLNLNDWNEMSGLVNTYTEAFWWKLVNIILMILKDFWEEKTNNKQTGGWVGLLFHLFFFFTTRWDKGIFRKERNSSRKVEELLWRPFHDSFCHICGVPVFSRGKREREMQALR